MYSGGTGPSRVGPRRRGRAHALAGHGVIPLGQPAERRRAPIAAGPVLDDEALVDRILLEFAFVTEYAGHGPPLKEIRT